ncbi:MAG: recombinase family protein [Bacilli bacterium]|nr:recombinase family protein [Bacilli bacterium]
MKKWVIGLYPRLSFDERGEEESNSVTTQIKMMKDYLVDKRDIIVYKSYPDDGYTGTDFDRPGYKKMLEDIQKRKINAVIVKDLSRLGRNYIEVGRFIDEIVSQYGLRFISVNDNVDSFLNPNIMNSLEIPFKNLMNESYSKDTSKKMRTSLQTSKKSGNFIGKTAPFGYLKNPDDIHQLIIDKEAADIVKKIFNLVLTGKSKQEIAKEFNNNHIPTPSIYLKQKYNITVSKITKTWSIKVLDNILQNRIYIGDLIQGKRERISHKNHSIVRVAENDWIVSENTHNSIIKKDVFEQAQSIMYNRNVKVNKDGKFYKYTGYVKCSECNCNLYRRTKIKNGKEKYFYYCSTYIKNRSCNKHYIQEKELDEIVLNTINNYIKLICDINNKINDTISDSSIEYNIEAKQIRLIELDKLIKKYKDLLNDLLNDYKYDYISQDDYDSFKEKYLYEINKLNLEKESITRNKINSYNLDWIKCFQKVGKIEKIDRNIIDSFIENIYIGNNKDVEIAFRFQDQYKVALEYLKNQKNVL